MNTYYVAGLPYSDELYHHGTKGMKWGIRRYQNPDGSLTELGRIRYRKKPEESDRFEKRLYKYMDKAADESARREDKEKRSSTDMSRAYNRVKKEENDKRLEIASKVLKNYQELPEEERKMISSGEAFVGSYTNTYVRSKLLPDIMADRKKLNDGKGYIDEIFGSLEDDYYEPIPKPKKEPRKKAKDMTTAELQDAVNKVNLEKQYTQAKKELKKANTGPLKKAVGSLLSTVGNRMSSKIADEITNKVFAKPDSTTDWEEVAKHPEKYTDKEIKEASERATKLKALLSVKESKDSKKKK